MLVLSSPAAAAAFTQGFAPFDKSICPSVFPLLFPCHRLPKIGDEQFASATKAKCLCANFVAKGQSSQKRMGTDGTNSTYDTAIAMAWRNKTRGIKL